jgi:iron complex transport system permease protein
LKAQSKLYFYLIISAVLLAIIAVLSLNTGVYDFGEKSPFMALWQFIKGDSSLSLSDKYVIWDVRAARIIMAILVGSMLSV